MYNYILIFYYILQETIFLEAQVQNITTSLMCMVAVKLEPSSFYNVLDLNKRASEEEDPCEDDNDDTLIFGNSYLNPMDTRQYLYQLLPKKEYLRELQAKVSPRFSPEHYLYFYSVGTGTVLVLLYIYSIVPYAPSF